MSVEEATSVEGQGQGHDQRQLKKEAALTKIVGGAHVGAGSSNKLKPTLSAKTIAPPPPPGIGLVKVAKVEEGSAGFASSFVAGVISQATNQLDRDQVGQLVEAVDEIDQMLEQMRRESIRRTRSVNVDGDGAEAKVALQAGRGGAVGEGGGQGGEAKTGPTGSEIADDVLGVSSQPSKKPGSLLRVQGRLKKAGMTVLRRASLDKKINDQMGKKVSQ